MSAAAATRREHALDWAYATPALLLMGAVQVLPIGQAVASARRVSFVWHDGRLLIALRNTLVFTVSTVAIELLLGLLIALALLRPFAGRTLLRAAVLLPWALPTAVMALCWQWIFNAEYGVLGDLLFRAGLSSTPHIAWLSSPGLAMSACVIADVWKTTPFMALLLMSGLATIPDDLYEAAALDGAGPLRQLFVITLPLLRPTIALAVIFRAIQSFGVFDLIWVLTGGGPGGATQTIALYVYDNVFRYLDFGYGCTLTLVMAACLGALAACVGLVGGRDPA